MTAAALVQPVAVPRPSRGTAVRRALGVLVFLGGLLALGVILGDRAQAAESLPLPGTTSPATPGTDGVGQPEPMAVPELPDVPEANLVPAVPDVAEAPEAPEPGVAEGPGDRLTLGVTGSSTGPAGRVGERVPAPAAERPVERAVAGGASAAADARQAGRVAERPVEQVAGTVRDTVREVVRRAVETPLVGELVRPVVGSVPLPLPLPLPVPDPVPAPQEPAPQPVPPAEPAAQDPGAPTRAAAEAAPADAPLRGSGRVAAQRHDSAGPGRAAGLPVPAHAPSLPCGGSGTGQVQAPGGADQHQAAVYPAAPHRGSVRGATLPATVAVPLDRALEVLEFPG
ncbi:hypothetical protein [Streptomyces sp. NPDC048338]|uniref:hypothetical protein n=1 Tax=Streptomyces sp. NPDC048338 TaxID=3365536 RepID=UPI0037196136